MAFLPSSLLLVIYAAFQLPPASLAFPSQQREANGSFQLSYQLHNLIPKCAHTCFISFLNVNFDAASLGSSPNLAALCSHNSSSGYTVAEGAVECIVGEDGAGGCSKTGVGGDDGSLAIIASAYGMCEGQKGALSNTHTAITATLSTSGTAVFVVPVVTSSSLTTSRTVVTTSRSKTSLPATITAPPPAITSPIPMTPASGMPTIFSTSSFPPTQTTALPASTSTTAAAVSSSKSKAPKIAGIAVGSLAGIAAAVGLCAFLRRLRKRRNRDRGSDIFPFTPESTKSLAARRFTYYSREQGAEKGERSPGFAPGGTRNGVAAKISPTFQSRNNTPPVRSSPSIRLVDDRNMMAPTIRTSSIGLAVSAEPFPTTLIPAQSSYDRKRSSKLLPEKPTLELEIPNETYSRPGQVFNFPSPPRPQTYSIMNRPRPKINFGPSSSGTQISQQQYNPGNRREAGNTLSKDFQPYLHENTPYYAGDVNTPYEQNMALRKYLASEKNLHVRPLEIRRDSAAPSPQSRKCYPAPSNKQYPPSQSSSQVIMNKNYSHLARPQNTYQPNSLPPFQNTNSKTPANKSYNAYQQRPPGRDSTGSATSFESFSSGDDIEAMSPGGTVANTKRKSMGDHRKSRNDNLINNVLSPVKESPSPVSYPKIPGRLGSTVRMIPPPARPDFTKVMGSGSVPRKPVPMAAVAGMSGEKPWRQAELAAAAARRSSCNGSIHKLSPSDAVASPATSNLPSQRILQKQGFLQQPRNQANGDRVSIASTNASLLTKRRGEKLAANLTLNCGGTMDIMIEPNASMVLGTGNTSGASSSNSNYSKWRVPRDEEVRDAKSPGWRPQFARRERQQQAPSNSNPYRVCGDFSLEDDQFLASGKENLSDDGGRGEGQAVPGTPGWKPRLMPTRRGEELFLSVE